MAAEQPKVRRSSWQLQKNCCNRVNIPITHRDAHFKNLAAAVSLIRQEWLDLRLAGRASHEAGRLVSASTVAHGKSRASGQVRGDCSRARANNFLPLPRLRRELDEVKPTHVLNAAGITGRPNVDWSVSFGA